ncbi:MAG: amidoligase family protein, partial [Clostridia bacterium]|nr:amidoligase family protein [Clostridia bacterium]
DFTKYIIDNINKFNIDNINNVLGDENLLLLFPESIKSRDYLLECLKNNKKIEVSEILEKLNEEEQLTDIDDRRKQWLETYEKYGSSSVLSLSDKLLETLNKEKVSDSLSRTHGIFNSEDIILTGILGDEIYNNIEDERNRLKAHLKFFDKRKISDSEIEFFANKYKTIAKEDVNILDVYYLMNIENNPDVSKILSNFPENLRKQVLKVNLRAKNYEIINVINALKNDIVAPSLQIENNENIKRNLSSMPKEKIDELKKLIIQTNFKKYKTKLDINPNITIGYEVEVEGVSPHIIKNILANNEVKDTLFKKQSINPNLSRWGIKYDPTVSTGVELVSPILMDNEKDWKDLKDVIDMLKSVGGKIDGQCGGHIHIGSNILGTDGKAWENFLTIWSECESSIYKISNPANEDFRDGVGEFASPTKSIIDEILKKGSVKLDTHEDVKKMAEQYSRMYIPNKTKSGRYKGLNLKPISDGKQNTVEFRMPNGQLDAIEVQRNIELFARIMEVSKKISIEPEYKKEIFDKMKNKETTEEEKLMCLLDLSFNNIVDKAIYYERYLSRDKELIISNEPYEKFVDRKSNYDDNERF